MALRTQKNKFKMPLTLAHCGEEIRAFPPGLRVTARASTLAHPITSSIMGGTCRSWSSKVVRKTKVPPEG